MNGDEGSGTGRSEADLWRLTEEQFSRLVELSEGEQERALLELATLDPQLADSVRRLLVADRRAESGFLITDSAENDGVVLEGGAAASNQGEFAGYSLGAGDTVGAFRIQRAIGRGGMGEVYLASRSSTDDGAFTQDVALKLIHAVGVSQRELHERFLRERRILARLTHPSIARLIEVGSTVDSRPFLAMEYVDGAPITKVCESRQLGLDETLELFLQTAAAVQFAHENLVIHRDIKPSNVLVSQPDANDEPDSQTSVTARPVVKLLDFGIAALREGSQDGPPLTVAGLAPATPEYAAPEQLRGEPVNTATDVFGLGVLLFELVSGERPPAWPPASGEALGRTPPTPAASPRLGLRRLPRDLVAITRRAIEEDPTRRYLTVAELIRDLEAFRSGRPVAARHGTRLYRAHKFALRHRVALVALLAVTLSLVVGVVGMWLQGQRAEANAVRAQRVTELLLQMFEGADPAQRRGEQVSAVELLDLGAERVAMELADEPLLRGEIETVLGRLYRSLGSYEASEFHLESAVELLRSAASPSAQLAAALEAQARLNEQVGDLARARELLEEAERLYSKSSSSAGRGAPQAFERGALLASVLFRLGEREQAEQELVRLRRGIGDLSSPLEKGLAMAGVGDALVVGGQFEEAAALLREASSVLGAALDPPDPRLADVWTDLGVALYQLGRREEALEPWRTALHDRQLLYDAPHVEIAHGLRNLSAAERAAGDEATGLEMLLAALAMYRELFVGAHPDIADTLNNLGVAHVQRGDLPGAVPYFEQAAAMQRELLGDSHPGLVLPLASLGNLLTRLDREEEAEGHLLDARRIARAALPPEHPHQALVAHNLASLYLDDPAVARPLLEEAIEGFERALGAEHPNVGVALLSLGKVKAAMARSDGDLEASREAFRRSAEILEGAPAHMADRLLQARLGEADVLRRLERHGDLVEALVGPLEAAADAASMDGGELVGTCEMVARVRAALESAEETKAELAERVRRAMERVEAGCLE